MAEEKNCQQCGAELPANAPGGVCPKCVMKLGLPTGVDPEKPAAADGQGAVPTSATPPGGFVPPEPAELNEKLPGLEIIELLGQGGMGAVYKARQKQLDRIVALKILPPEVGKDPAFAERFAREARSLAKLNHPHIVTLYEFGQSDDSLYYFIMEFVDGTDLRHVIRTGELACDQALVIVPQICEALQYAHEEGIVHRDIKPENIFLDKRGGVKIGDFGLAKLLDRPATAFTLTQTRQGMGTPLYMAPEQIEGAHQVDHRADIYSLGVVFYEMLTGELPLGRFDPPSQKVHVDVRLDEVVLHTLEKEPRRRYQQVSEVKTDIEAIGVAAMPDEPAEKSPPAVSSRKKDYATSEDEPEKAWQHVRIPAIGLVVTGLIGLLGLVGVLLLLGCFSLGLANGGFAVAPVAILFVSCLPALIILTGGRRMSHFKSHGLAVAAAILALMPIHAGFLLGLPMGIWALIVLTRSDVQKAFTLAAKGGAPRRKGFPLWSIVLVLIILALFVLTPFVLYRMFAVPASRIKNARQNPQIRYQSVTGESGTQQPLTSEPNVPGYENAHGTANLKIKVGPTQFAVSAVARRNSDGISVIEDGLGRTLDRLDFKTPDYSDQAPWMDTANIYVSPGADRYDVLELRVFDHATKEFLQLENRLAVGYDISNSVVQLRSVGGLLPDSVDVWMRVLHNPENSPMWRLNAVRGSSASLGNISLLFRELRDGQWSYSTRSGDSNPPLDPGQFPVGQVQWTKKNETDTGRCMAAFDFVNVKRGPISKSRMYQIAAIAKDGTRHIPDFPHFLAARSAITLVIEFDLPAAQVSHFEIRPFLGRDRFYFDGIRLPHVDSPPSAPPPTVPITVNGKEGGMMIEAFAPAKVNVRVLKGTRASGVGSRSNQAWVKMTEEPFENTDSMVTIIYEIDGLRVGKCSFRCFNADGDELSARNAASTSTGHPYGLTVGYETKKVPIEKIDHVLLSIHR